MADPSSGRESTPDPTPSQETATPSTGSEKENRPNGTSSRAQKRKRGDDRESRSRNRRRTLEPEEEESEGDEELRLRSPSAHPEDYFDPAQPIAERRMLTRQLRDLQKDMTENQDEYINDDGSKIQAFLNKSDKVMARVKQTNEATIDAKGLLKLSDLHSKRVNLSIAGHTQQGGVDIDEFVSKCVTFMRHGGGIEDDEAPELTSTQRQRRAPRRDRGAVGSDDEDADGEGDAYNWAHFGRYAAIPSINRPAVPGFMLGPMSVKKKARKFTQRAAPLRIQNLVEVRPQVLNAEDMAKNEKNDLTVICKKILTRLERVQEWAQNRVEDEITDDMSEDEQRQLMDRYSLRDTGGIDMLRFVVNPHSFGQTVENIFYVSFLIRDGYVKLAYDSLTKLPALEHVAGEDSEEAASARRGALRHQSILSIDMPTWKEVIKAFDIREPMIPHRQELQAGGPGARGWYN
ncbi:Nse4 C-terminal-domain-containing protein [Coniochaeta sp. 2T2.1]|nr:Nse4 C-terminal-domain-containing protein [Coniochaeta sp. 2T2.1]